MLPRIVARSDASTIDTGSSAMIRRGADQRRARHHDPLPLAAAQLVRVAAERLFRAQPDGLQRLLDQRPRLGLAAKPVATGVSST